MVFGEIERTKTHHLNIFDGFIINNEIHVNEYFWDNMLDNYSEEFIIKEISDAIVKYDIKLPYREITLNDVRMGYESLSHNNEDLIQNGKWYTKFDYKYSFLDKYISISKIGNKASDYFHQIERWKCDATGYPSPQKTWDNERFRLTLFKALFSLNVEKINPTILRNIISLRKYIAAQFRPSAAKAIYDYFKAENVLDFSMGWGDRILGAHTSPYVKRYVGFDPNINLLQGYVNQINTYQNIGKRKQFKLYPWCAEDENFTITEEFDLIFTSPPYFDKEKYDQSDLQSYKKYKTFESWMEKFLFKTIDLRSKNLKSGGHLVVNISDIYSRKKRYEICDRMNDYIIGTGKFEYIGAIGLRMPKRPMSKSSNIEGVYGEPIWVHRKL